MTTPPLDKSAPGDVPAIQAVIASSAALRQERRALYQLAAELLGHADPPMLDPDVIDSPLARNHIGDALAGRGSLESGALVGISAIAAAGGIEDLRVASAPEANTLLGPALDTVRTELDWQEASCGSPALLTETDGERFTEALSILRDGITFARAVSPALIADLIAHIALIGIIDPRRAGRMVSASPRTFPGLVLVRGPRSDIEIAEALVHEGAHQKFFDLAITHDLVNTNSDKCQPFHPPWGPKGRFWPIEQALAACHAYVCLAWFGQDLGEGARTHSFGPESLIPVASERSAILRQWLLGKEAHLGADAHLLLDGLIGSSPRATRVTESCAGRVLTDYVIDTPLEFRHCGSPDRVLVGLTSRPPQLYWVSDDAAEVLEILAHRSLDDVAHIFAQRWHVQELVATDRLTSLLADLHGSGLVEVRNTPPGHA